MGRREGRGGEAKGGRGSNQSWQLLSTGIGMGGGRLPREPKKGLDERTKFPWCPSPGFLRAA